MRVTSLLAGLVSGVFVAASAATVSAVTTTPQVQTDVGGEVITAQSAAAVRVTSSPSSVKAGQSAVIDAAAPDKARCRLVLRKGSRSWRSAAVRQRNAKRNYLQLAWQQGKGRAPGVWRATVSCRLESGVTATKSVKFRVKASKKSQRSVPKLRTPVVTRLTTRNPLEGFGAAGAPPFGTRLVSGSDWFGGQGVDIISNGPGSDCPGGVCQRHAYGIKWQCVELINRFIMTRGWSGRIPGNARDIFGNASVSVFDKHAAGDGYQPVPGDIIVWRGGWGGYGHVAVVDGIGGGAVGFVEQNASPTGRNSRALGANGVPAAYSKRYTFLGYLHAKANRPATVPPSVPPPPPAVPPTNPPPPTPTSATITGNPCSTAEKAPNCVPARVAAAPNNSSAKLGTFSYGQKLTVRCWATGQVITDGNNSDPSDDGRTFTSDLWYGVDWNGGRGYVAATWTTKNNNKFGLPAC